MVMGIGIFGSLASTDARDADPNQLTTSLLETRAELAAVRQQLQALERLADQDRPGLQGWDSARLESFSDEDSICRR